MTKKDKNPVENTRKDSKRSKNKSTSESKKERLATQLRENLLRRKNKENHGGTGAISDKL